MGLLQCIFRLAFLNPSQLKLIMTKPYLPSIELQMQELSNRLSEKDRRQYAGIEALKVGHGGVSYIARLFCCSRNTVLRGIEELQKVESQPVLNRKSSGGCMPIIEKFPEINEVFLQIISERTVGDPMNTDIRWTALTLAQLAELLTENGFKVSRDIVGQLLKKHGYVKPKFCNHYLLLSPNMRIQ